jgi:hypothetical protein
MNGTWAQFAAASVVLTLALGGCVGEADEEAPPAVVGAALSADAPASSPEEQAAGLRNEGSGVDLLVEEPGASTPNGSDPEPSPWKPGDPVPTQR